MSVGYAGPKSGPEMNSDKYKVDEVINITRNQYFRVHRKEWKGILRQI